MKVIALPDRNLADLPNQLRRLADQVEAGELGDVVSIAWVLELSDENYDCGLIGQTPMPKEHMYYLLGMAKKYIEEL